MIYYILLLLWVNLREFPFTNWVMQHRWYTVPNFKVSEPFRFCVSCCHCLCFSHWRDNRSSLSNTNLNYCQTFYGIHFELDITRPSAWLKPRVKIWKKFRCCWAARISSIDEEISWAGSITVGVDLMIDWKSFEVRPKILLLKLIK